MFAFRVRRRHRPLAVGFFFANPNAAAAREYIERFLRVESVSCAAATLSYADRHLDAAATTPPGGQVSLWGGGEELEELFSGASARASSADDAATRNAPEPVELPEPGEPVSSAKLAFARALRGDNAGTKGNGSRVPRPPADGRSPGRAATNALRVSPVSPGDDRTSRRRPYE